MRCSFPTHVMPPKQWEKADIITILASNERIMIRPELFKKSLTEPKRTPGIACMSELPHRLWWVGWVLCSAGDSGWCFHMDSGTSKLLEKFGVW